MKRTEGFERSFVRVRARTSFEGKIPHQICFRSLTGTRRKSRRAAAPKISQTLVGVCLSFTDVSMNFQPDAAHWSTPPSHTSNCHSQLKGEGCGGTPRGKHRHPSLEALTLAPPMGQRSPPNATNFLWNRAQILMEECTNKAPLTAIADV